MTANWKARWEKQHLELAAARREVTALRAALDELNADTETILNDAALIGHEMAKSHAIRRQMTTIRSMRVRLNASREADRG
jgi:hypothetical protein